VANRYRVVQWATGNVGRRALPAIIRHPEMELVGLWAHSDDKVGKDAGDLVGEATTGILASDDVEALLALRPDCVCYMPHAFDDDLVVRMLRAGINVVTTCGGFLTGTNFPERRKRFDGAAREGGATFMGTGFDPGYANLLTGFLTGACRRVHSAHLVETLDCTTYPVAEAWRATGFGQPVDERRSGPFTIPSAPDAPRPSPEVPGFFDSLDLVADMLELELERKEWTVERAAATADIDLGWMTFPKGTVAGQRRSYIGYAHGRPVVTLTTCWTMTFDALDRAWNDPEGYRIEIEGEPRVEATIAFETPKIAGLSDETDVMSVLMVGAAMPAVHAIPFVCAAPPGLTTPTKLPLFGARYAVV
jgi:2,4-diaminopentanoate dehydrogenase